MPADFNIFRQLLQSISRDSRITVWHLAVVFGVIQLSVCDDLSEPILVSRRQVMYLARISSISTYHKCMKELQDYGYIVYLPSFHPGIRSRIYFQFPVDEH